MKHQDIPMQYNHTSYRWVWANAAARIAETDVSVADVYKDGLQLDTATRWTLLGIDTDDLGEWGTTNSNFQVAGPTELRAFTFPDEDATVFTNKTHANVLQAALHGLDVTDTDSVVDYEVQLSPPITSYVTGSKYRFKAASTNAGAADADLGGGAVDIKKMTAGAVVDVEANDIYVDQYVELVFDGTDMIIVSSLGNAPTGGGGGTGSKTLFVWDPFSVTLPTTAPAYLSWRANWPIVVFVHTTSTYIRIFGVMPEGVNLASGVKLILRWIGNATSGDVRYGAGIMRGNTDIDADSFDSTQTVTTTTNATSGIINTSEITIGAGVLDGLLAGEQFMLQLYRDTTVGSNMAAYAGLISVEMQQVEP